MMGHRGRFHSLINFLFILLIPRFAETNAQNARVILHNVSDSYWAWRLWSFPERATAFRVHEYDDRLDEYTPEQFADNVRNCEELLEQLNKADVGQLSGSDRDTYDVLHEELSQYVRGYEFRNFGNLNPINFLGGIHRPPGWVSRMRFRNEDDFRLFNLRISKFPTQVDQIMSLMKEAIRLRRTNHRASMIAVPSQIDRIMVPSNESVFYWPYRERLANISNSSIPENRKKELAANASKIIDDEINPAFLRLKEFISGEYMNETRPSAGVWSWEFGRRYYEECLRFHLSTAMTAQQVHDLGWRELGRIKAQMEQIMRNNGFQGTLPEFFIYLRTERRADFYNRSSEWLFNEYKHQVYNRINPKLSMIVKNDPSVPIRVLPMPYDGPPALYGGNTYWVNLRNAENRPTFTMMALSIHEANPGHHLQTTYARKLELPNFRRFGGPSRYYAAPFNFPWYTSYTEGWALYAEYLGEEMQLYNRSALEMFGRYSWEIVRACRLVVDTGMHAFGMTREEAIDLMANHSAMPRFQIALEVDRYITWPGQACAYKIGELEIKRWRQEATQELGSAFDVRDYNEVVLGTGRVPLGVAQRAVSDYVRARRPSTAPPTAAARGAITIPPFSLVAVCCLLVMTTCQRL